ncbi:MAG TPA: diguanylate cyclase [Anaerolineales bacterium]|jgi:two-component system chemotaxis response regulator CheY|nr:diguanylate cyclase [Anaerolineales bacterium]HMR97989.1 diguanylate cyclase [Anaerolineales bacterium]HNQ96189.1 diguanylate cyclase [Anaerolineales bacterium]HNS62010.1 diguanylate cyclase [Anaerolineales bacterium]
MKILVINNDLMERTVIQQVLQVNGHEVVIAENSDTAWKLLHSEEIRFVIADRIGTDIDERGFIRRVRDARPPYYIYILLITQKVQESDVTTPRTGADDYLRKPIVPVELKSRVNIGERILSLGDRLVQAKDTLDHTAMLDNLTGALNQMAFINLARGELERARRNQASLSLIAFQAENFKAIVDQHGKNIGNDVLSLISQGIRDKSRPYDGLGRYEGDTFILILPGVVGAEAEKVSERILKGIANTKITLMDDTELKVNLSVGIVSSGRITASTEIEALMNNTREALALAKHAGDNQIYTVYV